MYFFCGVLAVAVTVEAGQQASSGQHSDPSEQHAVFLAVLVVVFTLATSQQFGGQSSEQPGGQVGSRQQSTAFTVFAWTGAAALAWWYTANTTATAMSGKTATADQSIFRFIDFPPEKTEQGQDASTLFGFPCCD